MAKPKKKNDLVEKVFNQVFSGRVIGASGDAGRKRNEMIKKIRGK
jgi:hypothetical protein|tara:strand:+ start:198 stop:332 length:135 start_codon:yes stop_codon:yes gene_type:complete